MSKINNNGDTSSRYPCGTCDLTVTWEQKGVACETCGMWYHAHCQSITTHSYNNLDSSDVSWHCLICNSPNYSFTTFDLHGVEQETSQPSSGSNYYHSALSKSFSPGQFDPKPLHSSTPTRANQQNKQRSRPLRILNINFRSLRGKRPETLNLIDSAKPDIIVGTETHLDSNVQSSEILTDSYTVYRKDRNSDGGGVLIAVKKDIDSSLAPELDTQCEILWIKIATPNQRHLYICAYYRPKAGDKESLIQFETSVRRASISNNAQILIAGDLNFPGWDWTTMTLKQSCPYPDLHRSFLDILHDIGLEQMVLKPTRLENTLDLIITNCPDKIPRIEILPGLSDHDVVYAEFNTKISVSNRRSNPIPLYKRADWQSMKSDMAELQDEIYPMSLDSSTSAEDMWTIFKNRIQDSTKRNIPHKIPKKKDGYPWITAEIKKILHKRDQTYRKMKKHGTEDLKREVKKLRQKVQQKLRQAYWNYVNELFSPNDQQDTVASSKRFWTYIKHQRSAQSGVAPLKMQGQLITDPKSKAEALNEQFFTAFSEGTTYDKTMAYEKCNMSDILTVNEEMPDLEITTTGVEKLLQELKPSKAAGPDGISPRILKTLAVEVAPILTWIFQKSLDTGIVPKDWRTANVTPVFKKGEHYSPSNYRPVSLTSIPCKIMEHIIVSNLMTFLEKSKILTPHQHGFRKRHSCETQLLELTDEITRNLDSGLTTDVVVLDFAKAFDKVNHSLLAHKLDHYGVRGNVLQWIVSFLNDRRQAVVVEGSRSDFIPVRSGVPQGSVLGPSLFLVYINDLPSNVNSNTRLFADDTAIDRVIRTEKDCQKLQEDLDALSEWESRWEMEFHPDKCSVLRVHRGRKTTPPLKYTLHGQQLQQVTNVKYLGVTIQDNGGWDCHIDNVTKKANRTLGFLRRNLKIGSRKIKERAYKALIRPVLEYSACVWDPHTKKEKDKLEKVQRRSARFVLSRHRQTSSVGEMINDLNWPMLEKRRKSSRLCMLYKIIHKQTEVHCKQLQTIKSRARRSHANQLQRIEAKKDYRHMAFFPRTIREWNSLPGDIALSPSLDTFHTKVLSQA